MMGLSNDLIVQFVKATKDTSSPKNESTVYGTVVENNGKTYVQIDGSDQLTPVSTTTSIAAGERVTVLIKDHTATVTGNFSAPSVNKADVNSAISEFDVIVADRITTEEFNAEIARIDTLVADNATIKGKLTAVEADIESLEADNVTIREKLTAVEADITKLSTEKLDADFAEITYATITSLEAINATINNLDATYATITDLEAERARIDDLDAKKLSAVDADLKYANIDFTNITEAAIVKLFSDSGIIKDLIVSEGYITGELVGVTIKGDLIEAGTLVADKLVVKGEDGVYYKLNVEAGATTSEEVTEEDLQNGLHGTAIIAKTITAEKIAVDDLVAFDATIGGFNITTSAIYSGVKASADNTTQGVYMDRDGQFSLGDSNNYLRYIRNSDGEYVLQISASSLTFGATGTSVMDLLNNMSDLEIGARNLIRNSTTLEFDDYWFASNAPETASE